MPVVDIEQGQRGQPAPRLVAVAFEDARRRGTAPRRIVHAHSEDGLLTWSYTAGLRESLGHPEFLLTGLDPFLSESVLNQLSNQVARGRTYTESEMQKDLLHRLTCAFRTVPSAMAHVLMPMADTIVDGQCLQALQCIYPDHHNRLPWHFGYNTSWHEVQPLFTAETPLTKAELTLLRAAAGVSGLATQHRVHRPF